MSAIAETATALWHSCIHPPGGLRVCNDGDLTAN
mgnify:FL=1